jgi:predicted transcriptional regulator of viral defense system
MKYPTATGGIEAPTRTYLEMLHRSTAGPFTASEAATVLGVPERRARRLVRYLADRGWLDRVRRGAYVTVPLDAHRSGSHREDPWIVAMSLFGPCYIGGWSAAEHWHLTEQVFRDILVLTARRPRDRAPVLQDTRYRLRTAAPDKHFGTTPVWRDGVKVLVSDPSRTLVDVLSSPGLGGGITHVAGMVGEYMASEHRDDELLVSYARRLGNRAVFKRLGYVLETLKLDAPRLVEACLLDRSAGISKLDPDVRSSGHITSRWGLAVNVRLDQADGE